MVQWDNEEITLWCRINEEITCGKMVQYKRRDNPMVNGVMGR
jgi:hypothetical protein